MVGPEISYAATGGSRVTEGLMLSIRDKIVGLANNNGFPDDATIVSRSKFDADCTVYLSGVEDLKSGEALRDDVWAFIATALLPDVTSWRFSSRTADRFYGGDRNMFQRLWYRYTVFDRGHSHPARWELIEALTEDAIAQIIERPSIRADRRLALAIAEGWLRYESSLEGSRSERVMRRAVRDIRVRSAVQILSVLSNAELAEQIDWHFRQASLAEFGSVQTDQAQRSAMAASETY
jgi:hypothetical protein